RQGDRVVVRRRNAGEETEEAWVKLAAPVQIRARETPDEVDRVDAFPLEDVDDLLPLAAKDPVRLDAVVQRRPVARRLVDDADGGRAIAAAEGRPGEEPRELAPTCDQTDLARHHPITTLTGR